jgi:hypothetical protein
MAYLSYQREGLPDCITRIKFNRTGSAIAIIIFAPVRIRVRAKCVHVLIV